MKGLLIWTHIEPIRNFAAEGHQHTISIATSCETIFLNLKPRELICMFETFDCITLHDLPASFVIS